jgi:hypothetical protein
VRPFVSGNKTDATDARAIWLAIQQLGTKFVGMKTLESSRRRSCCIVSVICCRR